MCVVDLLKELASPWDFSRGCTAALQMISLVFSLCMEALSANCDRDLTSQWMMGELATSVLVSKLLSVGILVQVGVVVVLVYFCMLYICSCRFQLMTQAGTFRSGFSESFNSVSFTSQIYSLPSFLNEPMRGRQDCVWDVVK